MGNESNMDFRYERKFFISALNRYEVKSILTLHPCMFKEIFQKRIVNNIYFDTMNFDSYIDNVDGSTYRLKYRIRWYGNMFGRVEKPVLELKIKDAMLGRKESYKLKPFNLDNEINSSVISKVFEDSDIPDNIKQQVKLLTPSLLNRYEREYFISLDKKFRITIDNELAFYGIKNKYNSFLNKFLDSDSTILELKYDKCYDSDASIVTNHFPFRVTKSSKYVNGISKINYSIY